MESAGGFVRAVAGNIDQERLLAPVTEFKIMEVNTKWFNTVRTAQTAVTGALAIFERQHITWRDVEAIQIFLPTREHAGHDGIWNNVSRLRPQTRDSANHSIVFSLAVAMVDGELGPDQYSPAKLSDPNVLSVIDRTTLHSDPSLDVHWPGAAVTRLAMKTFDGQSYEATTLYPPGHHRNRLSDQQIQAKFTKLASPFISQSKRDAIIETVDRLDKLGSVNELTACLKRIASHLHRS
jgi:2-methylcitrate dehydratase